MIVKPIPQEQILMDPWLSPEDIEKYLRVHRITVYRWLRSGVIRASKARGMWRVRKSEVDRALANGSTMEAEWTR